MGGVYPKCRHMTTKTRIIEIGSARVIRGRKVLLDSIASYTCCNEPANYLRQGWGHLRHIHGRNPTRIDVAWLAISLRSASDGARPAPGRLDE